MGRVKLKSKRKKKKYLFILFIVIFIYSIYLTFNYLENKNISYDNKTLAKILLKESNSALKVKNESVVKKVIKTLSNPLNIVNNNYKGLVKNKQVVPLKEEVDEKEEQQAEIYIYNSHQTEEYKASNFAEYSVSPTVMVASYIMQEKLKEDGINSLVEERSISDYLKANNKKYVYSYEASRSYMETSKQNNPSLKYFIDVHRDSLTRDKTTTEINGKSYVKILFLIGLENPNFEKNLEFTTKINDKINELYPGLSKGIYKKGGEGVNGVYNQDFSPTTILVEFGGNENTIDEVFNSTVAFTKAFESVIKESVG